MLLQDQPPHTPLSDADYEITEALESDHFSLSTMLQQQQVLLDKLVKTQVDIKEKQNIMETKMNEVEAIVKTSPSLSVSDLPATCAKRKRLVTRTISVSQHNLIQ